MSNEKKQVYVSRANKEKEAYQKNLEAWTKRIQKSAHVEQLDVLKDSIEQLKEKLRLSK